MAEGSSKFPKLVIKAIRIYKLDIPLKDIFTIATMSLDKAQNVLVEIVTSEGISGWGEASSLRSIVGETQRINIAAAKELEQILVGKNPLAINALVQEMDAYLPHNTTMKSAVDMALYDIAAQVAGLPLYSFLGGSFAGNGDRPDHRNRRSRRGGRQGSGRAIDGLPHHQSEIGTEF